MEVNKARNMIVHREEILSRPARVWFQSDSEKKKKGRFVLQMFRDSFLLLLQFTKFCEQKVKKSRKRDDTICKC